jgi:hypothetical protein
MKGTLTIHPAAPGELHRLMTVVFRDGGTLRAKGLVEISGGAPPERITKNIHQVYATIQDTGVHRITFLTDGGDTVETHCPGMPTIIPNQEQTVGELREVIGTVPTAMLMATDAKWAAVRGIAVEDAAPAPLPGSFDPRNIVIEKRTATVVEEGIDRVLATPESRDAARVGQHTVDGFPPFAPRAVDPTDDPMPARVFPPAPEFGS